MSDNGIYYGCKDPEWPEPLDPVYFCKDCAKKLYKKALKDGQNMYLYWQMPDWKIKALKKLGLEKVGHKLIKCK